MKSHGKKELRQRAPRSDETKRASCSERSNNGEDKEKRRQGKRGGPLPKMPCATVEYKNASCGEENAAIACLKKLQPLVLLKTEGLSFYQTLQEQPATPTLHNHRRMTTTERNHSGWQRNDEKMKMIRMTTKVKETRIKMKGKEKRGSPSQKNASATVKCDRRFPWGGKRHHLLTSETTTSKKLHRLH